MQRGEIWWASLPAPKGSGPGFRRPVLVVQSDDFNRSKIQTTVVVAISSNMFLEQAPGNVRLSKKHSSLPKDSVVNVSQVITIDRAYLTECVGSIPKEKNREVSAGLALVLGL